MCTVVWPLPHRPVHLGRTWQEYKTPTDIALGISGAHKPSHFKVNASGVSFTQSQQIFFSVNTVPVSVYDVSLERL